MLIQINNYKYESYWEIIKKKPKEETKWGGQEQFINKLKKVEKYLDKIKKSNKLENPLNCKLCDKKNIATKEYKVNKVVWNEGLSHYIEIHNIKPSEEFMDYIYNFNPEKKQSINVRLKSDIYKIDDLEYIKLDKNQIMIMDALMRHGGYTKKYFDKKNKKSYRYSEHAGLIDFNEKGVDKIIISARTNRVDSGDEEIFLPKNIPEQYDYEYIFHTHPPTPKPGGRANIGILYEVPSISDIFHFLDHYNDGKTQGSVIISPEGLYNIRNLNLDKNKININEDDLYRDMKKVYNYIQDTGIKKYGSKFKTEYFYKKISQDTFFINEVNKVLNKYKLNIDYYPRQKDVTNKWYIDTVYLPVYVIEKNN
jgi:hypothetical protein